MLNTAMSLAAVIDKDKYKTVSLELVTELQEVWLQGAGVPDLKKLLKEVRAGATISAQLGLWL